MKEALQLREQGELLNAIALLQQLIHTYPEQDPLLYYELASNYDRLGEEKTAIPYYHQAIEQGLAGEERWKAFVQLGSSYRAIGDYEKANHETWTS